MELIATTEAHIKDVIDGPVKVMLWTKADPFPVMGRCVGVDTETELITDTNLAPPLVVLGVFDPQSMTCYISYWEDAAVFINQLSKRDIIQMYFNLGFDEQVLDNEDHEKALMDAIEAGRVRDMQIRIQLNDIATIGFIPWNHWSLADCSKYLLGIELDKGEKDDPESHRLTFKRGTPITEKQAVYLAWDCISTYGLSVASSPQPTEITHTRGMCVLAHISQNGFPVDMRVYKALTDKLQAQKDEYRLRLLTFGFPDPYAKDRDENGEYKQFVSEQARAFCMLTGNDKPLNLCKANMRMALVYMYNFEGSPGDVHDFEESVAYWLTLEKQKTLRKNEEKLYKDMVDEYDLLNFMSAGKEIVMNALMGHVLEDLLAQQGTKDSNGYDLKRAIEHASQIIDDNAHWLTNEKPVGPKTFLQQHIEGLLKQNPSLVLEKTEKSGEYKLTLKDMWRLEDAGVKDPFVDVLTHYKHAEKLLSTYLNIEYVKDDGKIHAHFQNLMRTGRTSSYAPNIQNLPSRDAEFPIKNIFTAPEGAVLCATDYSYVELTAFAQSCFSRFGFSVMKDVINAGLDPHRWFAGVMNGIITPDLTNKDDPEWVKKTSAFLKEHVTSEQRQHAKAANFGFPGAMGAERFYKSCRESGINISMSDAEAMRNAWIKTFKEMELHMRAEPAINTRLTAAAYGMERAIDAEEEDEDEGKGKHNYRAQLVCGQLRNRASWNAAANFHFQALTALCVKQAGWNLLYAGYGDRLTDLIHDEYVYWLWPNELKIHITNIEKLMLAAAKEWMPDIRVSLETSVMRHWDKHATPYAELPLDNTGSPIIEEPPFVKQLLTEQQKGA